MPTRIEFDVITGESTVVQLTQAEIDAAAVATATEIAAQALLLNPLGFISAVKLIFGGPVAILSLPAVLQSSIMLCIAAINESNWADVQAIIASQKTALNAANAAVYPAIKTAAVQYNIPIQLP